MQVPLVKSEFNFNLLFFFFVELVTTLKAGNKKLKEMLAQKSNELDQSHTYSKNLVVEIQTLKKTVDESKKTALLYQNIIKKPKMFLFYTGINKKIFNWIFKWGLKKMVIRKLKIVDQLLLVIVKLRIGFKNQDLAYRFNISSSGVSRILKVWLPKFWIRYQRAFFGVRVCNLTAPSYREKSICATFSSMEKQKKRSYNQRIQQIDKGTFTPLIFGATGGIVRKCSIFLSKLADKLAVKKKCAKSMIISNKRRKISFLLIRWIVCLLYTSPSPRDRG